MTKGKPLTTGQSSQHFCMTKSRLHINKVTLIIYDSPIGIDDLMWYRGTIPIFREFNCHNLVFIFILKKENVIFNFFIKKKKLSISK